MGRSTPQEDPPRAISGGGRPPRLAGPAPITIPSKIRCRPFKVPALTSATIRPGLVHNAAADPGRRVDSALARRPSRRRRGSCLPRRLGSLVRADASPRLIFRCVFELVRAASSLLLCRCATNLLRPAAPSLIVTVWSSHAGIRRRLGHPPKRDAADDL
ncbi:hypothetical protein PR202_gb23268 [Eleusine coracana subsp. coracana]|uniref:Uncharacterized protein n=1 Tax=Eleusine coracana subsp. coracana TaxID=191504 RepID=A0AAV5FJY5_ELECO|nr:hypothetical protein PR202_gb23268 [Eleusine coracana subsp. coracana]